MGATGIAPRLVPLLHGDDETLAERAAQVLARQGAAAEGTLRKERARRGAGAPRDGAAAAPARHRRRIEAVLDQLSDDEFGEQALQLLRAELDRGNDKLANLVEKSALARATGLGKACAATEEDEQEEAGQEQRDRRASGSAAVAAIRPWRSPPRARLLLRLIGYLARPSTLAAAQLRRPEEPRRSGSPRSPACAASSRRARRRAPRR